jgi:hypothetical protein
MTHRLAAIPGDPPMDTSFSLVAEGGDVVSENQSGAGWDMVGHEGVGQGGTGCGTGYGIGWDRVETGAIKCDGSASPAHERLPEYV